MEGELKKLGVPVNTYVDDLYVADFLRATRRGAILDRSMPSALAYPMMRGEEITPKTAKKLVVVWEQILRAAKIPVVYVWMQASHEVVKERCVGRWHPNKAQYAKLESTFKRVFVTLSLCKRRVVTTELSENETIKTVRQVVDDADD